MTYFLDTESASNVNTAEPVVAIGGSRLYWWSKRLVDVVGSLLLMPLLLALSIFVCICNVFWNRGTLFFVQERMGRNCEPFQAIKMRTMSEVAEITRGPDDPIEQDRISPFGSLLRRSRIDELPQIVNVLVGEMSLLGPRPDYFEHAKSYMETVPSYRERHVIRPGISGLAQVDVGYAVGRDATANKVLADLDYIRNAGFAQDARLVYRTLSVIFGRAGA